MSSADQAPFVARPTAPSSGEQVAQRVVDRIRHLSTALHLDPEHAPVDVLHDLDRALAVAAEIASTLPPPTSYWGHIAGANAPTFGQVSPASGTLNAVAAPLRYEWIEGDDPRVLGHVRFGIAYEGPPNSVHGGFVAAYFDEVLGLAQSLSGKEGMTGSLEVTYRRPTPIDRDLVIEARVESHDGRKIHVRGELFDGDVLCAEAVATFITVEWDQGPLAHPSA